MGRVNNIRGGTWRCVRVTPSPMTVKGCAVTITTRYNSLTAANIVNTGHYPMTGVIEEGYYEEENDAV